MCTCAKTVAGTPSVPLIGCVPWGISLFFEVGWLILALNLSGVQPNMVPWLGSVYLHSRRWTSLQEIFIISSDSEEFQPQAKAVLCKALQRQRETLPGSTVNKQVKSGSRKKVHKRKWTMFPGFPEEIWCPSSLVLQDTLLKDVSSACPCCSTAMELELEK